MRSFEREFLRCGSLARHVEAHMLAAVACLTSAGCAVGMSRGDGGVGITTQLEAGAGFEEGEHVRLLVSLDRPVYMWCSKM